MTRFISIILSFTILFSATAYAASIPEDKEMSVLEAMSINDRSEINSGFIMSLEHGMAMKLSDEQIDTFFYAASDISAKRRVVKHPFCGVSVVLETDNGRKTYFLNTGVQVGMYGDDNYLCYVPGEESEAIDLLYTSFMSAKNKYAYDAFDINNEFDYLSFPSGKWAVEEVIFGAANSLIPYETTEWFGKVISREAFCDLIANLLCVTLNYKDFNDYFADKKTAYLSNYFDDTDGKSNSINMLHAIGIVNGKSDNHFQPDDALTREEAAVILKKVADFLAIKGEKKTISFKDKSSISAWASDSVGFVASNGIMNGSDGNFNPKGMLSTEETITGVNRLFKLMKK